MQCKPCCFCFSGRSGAIIVSIVSLIICGVVAIGLILKIQSLDEGLQEYDSFAQMSMEAFGSADVDKIRIIVYIQAVTIAITILLDSLLIFGVKRQRLGFIKAVLTCYITGFLYSFHKAILSVSLNPDGFIGIVVIFLPIFIGGYIVFIIYRAHQETKDALSQESIENSNGFHQI